jgi:hypothetical protein
MQNKSQKNSPAESTSSYKPLSPADKARLLKTFQVEAQAVDNVKQSLEQTNQKTPTK